MISHKKRAQMQPLLSAFRALSGSCPYAQARLRLAAAGIARVSDKIYTTLINIVFLQQVGSLQ